MMMAKALIYVGIFLLHPHLHFFLSRPGPPSTTIPPPRGLSKPGFCAFERSLASNTNSVMHWNICKIISGFLDMPNGDDKMKGSLISAF
jgi:hypothetical protein